MVTVAAGRKLETSDVLAVAGGAKVRLSPATRALLARTRREVVEYVHGTSVPAYGFNRGFGHNDRLAVPESELLQLQTNLIRSHSAGLGPAAPREVVRAAMLLRAQSLAQGHSGVRPEVVEQLIEFLNKGLTPEVPLFGSVGASGDLAPLSHMALALIGEGRVFDRNGKLRAAGLALRAAKLRPLRLQMKEGLALNNGVQFSTALGILALQQCEMLLKTAALATAMSAQVMLGADDPFLAQLHALRPHPGSQAVAAWIWRLMQRSPIREAHRAYDVDGAVQDPYNLRCAGQVLGACHDLLSEARKTFEIEANSVTDNPIILPQRSGKRTRIVSGGHFHGMPVAVKLYSIMQSMGIIARLSNMRCVRYVDEKRNKGLGSDLIWPELTDAERKASSGMMIAEYASAALTNHIWGASTPSHLFSLSTDAGQEDMVSMSAGLAVRVWETLPRLAEVLAIELAFVAQAAAIRRVSRGIPTAAGTPHRWKARERRLSPICERALREVERSYPVVTKDRAISSDLKRLAEQVQSGAIVRCVEKGMRNVFA